jgi:hypothetical protein
MSAPMGPSAGPPKNQHPVPSGSPPSRTAIGTLTLNNLKGNSFNKRNFGNTACRLDKLQRCNLRCRPFCPLRRAGSPRAGRRSGARNGKVKSPRAGAGRRPRTRRRCPAVAVQTGTEPVRIGSVGPSSPCTWTRSAVRTATRGRVRGLQTSGLNARRPRPIGRLGRDLQRCAGPCPIGRLGHGLAPGYRSPVNAVDDADRSAGTLSPQSIGPTGGRDPPGSLPREDRLRENAPTSHHKTDTRCDEICAVRVTSAMARTDYRSADDERCPATGTGTCAVDVVGCEVRPCRVNRCPVARPPIHTETRAISAPATSSAM